MRGGGAAIAVAAAAVVTGCGADAIPSGSSGAVAAPTDAGTSGEAGTNAEAAGVPYTNTRYHYSIPVPGPATEAADGSMSAHRGVEAMTISVVSGAAAADPLAYAQGDMPKVEKATTQFQVANALARVDINGRRVVKVVYNSVGANAVTGKPEGLVNVRYYIPHGSGALAVMTYSIASNQYDPVGADDIEATFLWP
jgi:hypothetical protein